MKYYVKLSQISGDEHLLKSVCDQQDFSISDYNGETVLTSPRFNALESHGEVRRMAHDLCRITKQIAKSNSNLDMRFELGDIIYEETPDGRRKHVAVLVEAHLVTPAGFVTASIQVGTDVSDEERQHMVEEEKRREFARRVERASTLVSAAVRNKDVLTVLEMLDGELDPMDMYKIYEIIEDDMGGEIKHLMGDKQLGGLVDL